MKAYKVYYNTAGNSTSAIILVDGEQTVEQALAEKDKEYSEDCRWSRITRQSEIPLSNVMVRDLTVAELLKLIK